MTMNTELRRLIKADMNDEYLAAFLNIPVQRVLDAKQGIYEEEPVKPPKPKKAKLVPVTRPFPRLTQDMSDGERIIVLTNHGLSAQKIRKHLHNPSLSTQAIQKYILKKLGPAVTGNASQERHNQITGTFMPYVIEALTRLGKDRYTCEICLEPVPKGCIVHHTKYEGATVYDLMYVCGSCNLSRANKGLN